MERVTIHTYDRSWEGAKVVGTGSDSFTTEQSVLIVQHPHFGNGGDIDFYAAVDEQGRHLNVGDAAYWLTIEGE